MAQSLIEKSRLVVMKNSRRNITATAGGTIGIPIDRDGGLIDEIVLKITASAAFQVAPTAVDVRQIIERINLRSNAGDLIKSLSGQQVYDMARLTEKQATPIFAPGAGGGATGSVIYSQELHFEFDGAYFDALGSLKSDDLSKLDLEIIVASAAKLQAAAFVGSTLAAVPNVVVTVDPEIYARPEMAAREDVGVQNHFLSGRELANASTGVQTIELDPSNMTRFIGLHVDDMTGGASAPVPSDTIVGSVRVTQGARILADTDFRAMRFATEQKRGLNVTGFGVIDFGDQNVAFAQLDASPVQIQIEVLPGSPTWRLQLSQDMAKVKPL